MLIAHLTDLHIRPEGLAANRVSETNMLTERALRVIARYQPRPDVMVISGDLTESGAEREYDVLAELLRRHITIPVFVIPGNHDRRGALRDRLAHLPGVTSDPEFIHYTVEGYPLRLVMLDTTVPGADYGELCAERLAYLDRTLSLAPEAPTLVVMHHPPIVSGIGHMDAIALRRPEEFAAIVARHTQVDRILCGHHHRPIVGRVGHAIVSVSPSVAHQVELSLVAGAPGAMVMEPPAFQLHFWQDVGGLASHTAYVEGYPGPYPFLATTEHRAASA